MFFIMTLLGRKCSGPGEYLYPKTPETATATAVCSALVVAIGASKAGFWDRGTRPVRCTCAQKRHYEEHGR